VSPRGVARGKNAGGPLHSTPLSAAPPPVPWKNFSNDLLDMARRHLHPSAPHCLVGLEDMAHTPPAPSSPSSAEDGSEQVYVKVYLLDNSYKTFLIPKVEKAADFQLRVAEKLGFQNPAEDGYWFGFWESRNGTSLDRPLGKNELPAKIVKDWGPESQSKLVFMIKLYLECLTTSSDETVQYYRYLQAVHSVITDQYPVSDSTAVSLAALQFRAKFNTEEFMVGFLGPRIVEFIPPRQLLKRRGDQWEAEIADFFITNLEVSRLSEKDARSQYLAIVEQLPCYGCAFFSSTQYVTTQEPENIRLGVHPKGLLLFNLDNAQYFHMYELGDLLRWGYVPTSTFYVSVRQMLIAYWYLGVPATLTPAFPPLDCR
jgi:hypothetical protein